MMEIIQALYISGSLRIEKARFFKEMIKKFERSGDLTSYVMNMFSRGKSFVRDNIQLFGVIFQREGNVLKG